jgi:hypothetical protein
MLHDFFKFVFRTAERASTQPAGPQHILPAAGARPKVGHPTSKFLAQILGSALAQTHAQRRRGRAMHQSPDETLPEPVSQDADQLDGKIVRLMPKRRPEPEKIPDPQTPDDNDDPGPSAA